MPVSKFSVSLMPDTNNEIEKRLDIESNRSGTINKSLERYFAVLADARLHLRKILMDSEMAMILDVLNGTGFFDPVAIQLVYGEIKDSLIDGYAEKWEVDGPALVEKLRGLTYAENAALVDAVERWWTMIARGQKPAYNETLKK